MRDAALKSALRAYKVSNVPIAFTLSASIADDTLRAQQMRQVLQVWIPVGPVAAEQALNASTALAAGVKENLLQQVYQTLKPNDYLLPAK